ncbi:MAG: hypothetical protein AB1589_37885 [Cyanobacteriota bacterium]
MPQFKHGLPEVNAMSPLLDKTTDQRIVHHGTWEQFKFIQKGFDGSPGVTLYFAGPN